MEDINAMGDYVGVQVEKRQERTTGGLYIPDTANAENAIIDGKVVLVGPGRITENGTHIKPVVRLYDFVIFRKFEAIKVEINGIETYLVREPNILVRYRV